MVVSFISNNAALSAQGNIGYANDSASASISRLSSGQRIVKASDDVAGLSVGTILATGVTTLKQALANAGQGTSLLQVADGALSQVGTILARQKAIATQANSGTLSDTDRSYLNQEFQALTAQIDQIAGATSFSSVKLLDGSLSGAQALGQNTANTVSTTGAVTIANQQTNSTIANIGTVVATLATTDTFTINGYTVGFAAAGTYGTTAASGKVVLGASIQQTAQNLAAFLNQSTDARLSNWQFTTNGAAISALWTGGEVLGTTVSLTTSITTAANMTGTGTNTVAANASVVDGLAAGKVAALGAVTGNVLLTQTTANTAIGNGQGIITSAYSAANNSAIVDNAAFIGKLGTGSLGKITATYVSSNTAVFSLQAGDITYTTASTNIIAGAAGTAVIFNGADKLGNTAGGAFTLNFSPLTAGTFVSQAQLDTFVGQVNEALSGITFTQNRDVNTVIPGGTVLVGGVQVANLNNVSANVRVASNESTVIQDLKITAPTNGGTDAVVTAVINGETYQSFSGLGNQIGLGASIVLQNVNDSTKSFTIVTGNTAIANSATTSLDLSTQTNADAIATALKAAFGISAASGAAVTLQVGAQASDTVGIRVNSVASANLFNNASLDITTVTGALAAGAAVDKAIQTVTATRATVGALQSRLNFVSANLNTSISNQDAARSVLLDTDVSSESTKYATAQVQLQAGIAVLAQANQITQNLLKLIQ